MSVNRFIPNSQSSNSTQNSDNNNNNDSSSESEYETDEEAYADYYASKYPIKDRQDKDKCFLCACLEDSSIQKYPPDEFQKIISKGLEGASNGVGVQSAKDTHKDLTRLFSRYPRVQRPNYTIEPGNIFYHFLLHVENNVGIDQLTNGMLIHVAIQCHRNLFKRGKTKSKKKLPADFSKAFFESIKILKQRKSTTGGGILKKS